MIDKSKLTSSKGLRFKEVFYKFTHSKLFLELESQYGGMDVVSDTYISAEFEECFTKYMDKKVLFPDMFERDFVFTQSANERLVQLADFVAGSLARHFEPSLKETASREYLEIVRKRPGRIFTWPEEFRRYDLELGIVSPECDEKVARASFNLFHSFIEENHGCTDYPIFEQVLLLQILIEEYQYGSNRWMFADEIISSIKRTTQQELTNRRFSSNVVGPLRDKGILIASSDIGYKIPTSNEDCASFFRKSLRTVSPMLSRMHKFANIVRSATNGEIDILELEEMYQVKAAVNAELPSLAPTEKSATQTSSRNLKANALRHGEMSQPIA